MIEHPIVILSDRKVCDNPIRRKLRDAVAEVKRRLMDRRLQRTRYLMSENDYHDIVEWVKK